MVKLTGKTPQKQSSVAASELKVVGIGASAGGLEAFTELVSRLPKQAPFAYVLVQHLDPTHRSLLSELLGRSASLPVEEVTNNKEVAANHIYVIPPNCDLAIEGGVLKLSPRDSEKGPARSIDNFLKSLAADQRDRAVGVILSGAGSDGSAGIRAIKAAGGLTFAQDDASSKYDSMPKSAAATGCIDFVLPPAEIAAELSRFGLKPGRTPGRAKANERDRRGKVSRKMDPTKIASAITADWPDGPQDPDLKKIFVLLRTHMSLDFSVYRINTVRRRLNRRMATKRTGSLSAYYRYLRDNPEEVEALYQDLLIGVTSFFRNPKVFEMIKAKIFPRLARARENGETLRFWVAGCSTGQEAYSLAITFTEFCEKAGVLVPAQIFATDTNATSLEKARQGRFSKHQLEGLSPARLEKHFIRENDLYRVQKPIRDMVVFAQHNLLTDAPFTRVDLITCRNMLIYIEPAVQQKVIPTFHYALKAQGALVLGTSESVGSFTNLFASVEKSQKAYYKKAAVNRVGLERLPMVTSKPLGAGPGSKKDQDFSAPDAYKEADRLTIARYGPAGVLVNEDGDILQVRGKIEPFLEIPMGKPTLNVVKMARGSLALILQRGLNRARASNKPIKEKAVTLSGPQRSIDLEIVPFKSLQTRCFLILFERSETAPKPAPAKVGPAQARTDNRRMTDLRKEYTETRDHLVHLREQHETTVEELQASNEEVQSSNEELQSLNEELETSNEELESANEELTTLNEELATRNTELRESEHRLREQSQLVEIAPLLARSAKDRIIFWSYGAERLYGFTKEEALGQISHLFLAAQYPEPIEKIQAELTRTGRWEGEVQHRRKDGSTLWVATQWVNNIDPGTRVRAVLEVSSDITERKRAEESLRVTRELNDRILDSTVDCVAVLDLAGRIVFVNAGAKKAADRSHLSIDIGQHWMGLWTNLSRPQAEAGYRAALSGKPGRFEAMADKAKDPRWWDVVLQPITDPTGHPERLLAVCRDITEQKNIELKAAEEARLTALRSEVAIEIARGGDLPPILQHVTQVLLHHTDAASVRIWLASENGTVLKLAASAGIFPAAHAPQHELAFGEGRIGAIATSKRLFTTNQAASDPELCEGEWARRENLVGFAGYPVLFENRILGVLGVFSTQRIDGRLQRELGLSADAIALVVERKKAEDERSRLLMEAMEARNAALAASRAKDNFLATLSHELRTPLNPVLLLAADAAENPELSPAVRSTFETIRKNVLIEAKLIDDLLDLTRIAHGKLSLDMQAVDVNAALAEAVRIVSASVGKSSLNFALKLEADPARVLGDRIRLQQVFWNLLNNAVKFTPQGGRIEVKTSTTASGKILVQIRDTGIGMREHDLARVFDAFMQIERGQGGLGLGLAISRQLIEKHNGTIHAYSDGPGKGSTFEIVLPLLEVGAGAPPEAPAKPKKPRAAVARAKMPSPFPKRRLLLIEDHVSTREALKTLLAKRNFDVTVAGSLAEARVRLDDTPFDLVLSDLGLPDGNGNELIKELLAKNPEVVAIALSGYGTEDDIARSRDAGFLDHLTKPVAIDELDRVIADVLGGETALPEKAGA